MVSQLILNWLNEHKQRGDLAAVVKKLNPSGLPGKVTLQNAQDILAGKLDGKHGDSVVTELSNIIKAREEKNRQLAQQLGITGL